MTRTRLHLLLAAIALSFSGAAMAQWQWLDDNGNKVYSDRAPSPSVPANRILKQPGGAAPASFAVPVDDAAEAAAIDASPAQMQAAESAPVPTPAPDPQQLQEAEQAKAEAAAAAAEAAEIERKNAAIRKTNCESAQRRLTQLEPGRRLSTVNAKGETVFMDDATRATERQRAQEMARNNC
ncbi:DUF4124 domain-containing protein [Corticibacter populi]|uniref:DUF4124 domain-containing protein n=1 Tax=Corticibacter populi TaxID=1550736 RepID=A0A3M6QT30_9BURK|nr:DUF4124 domain-containing protein [Corticibacter populi]RMX05719.1 DUF4124 domain-containing protein [Corticibacter populi]RZS30987.1 hypothetical protein EV687_3189 [Corticibacter populi]